MRGLYLAKSTWHDKEVAHGQSSETVQPLGTVLVTFVGKVECRETHVIRETRHA